MSVPVEKIRLDCRLSAIAALIRPDSPVCDIGTDHGLLPCYLRIRGQKTVLASDINKNPLKQAEKTITAYGISGISLILSDGLENIPVLPDMDFVIAGMGGETIAEIMAGHTAPSPEQRFILQPMTRHAALRRGLYSLGYEILSETAVNAANKHYTIIYAAFTGNKKEISDLFSCTGKQTDREYISAELSKLRKMAYKDESLLTLIEEIKTIYDC